MANMTENRARCLEVALGERHRATLLSALEANNGDVNAALDKVGKELPKGAAARVAFAAELAEWSGDQVAVVEKLTNNKKLSSLADVARNFSPAELEAMLDVDEKTNAGNVSAEADSATKSEAKAKVAKELTTRLFRAQPAAMMARMIRAGELSLQDNTLTDEVVSLFENNAGSKVNNKNTAPHARIVSQPSTHTATEPQPAAPAVAEAGRLLRLAAVSPSPDTLPKLAATNLGSAFDIAEIPRSTFVTRMANELGSAGLAGEIHTNAVMTRMRNEQTLMAMREAIRGSGLAIVDGLATPEARRERLEMVRNNLGEQAERLNLETLFGSLDFCECDECLSVYSPAAYFVELLQYLRNNNLDPEAEAPETGTGSSNRVPPSGIQNTPVEMLFRRRPDLGCLELTCDNTFKVLPYVDLANEVMESFVVYQDRYRSSNVEKKQVTLNAFNVDGETTAELLSEPQHTNYEAYCVLKNAAYPFTLPYHQPLDAIRTYLEYLKTSRFELVNTFRTSTPRETVSFKSVEERDEFQSIHEQILQRTADAEFLKMSQEEYIILTREAFWPERYFELTQKQEFMTDVYRKNIGVRNPHEYYGYTENGEMLDTDESRNLGLTFVKKQFLKRTGIEYADLVELLKTRFINPLMPDGRPKAILDRIRYSYSYLSNLIKVDATSKAERLQPVIDAVFAQTESIREPFELEAYCGECHQRVHDNPAFTKEEITHWVNCYFERLGKLIVLNSKERPRLPVFGYFKVSRGEFITDVFHLLSNGQILDESRNIAYLVSTQTLPEDKGFLKIIPQSELVPSLNAWSIPILDENQQATGFGIVNGYLVRSPARPAFLVSTAAMVRSENRWDSVAWLPAQDSCNLDPVRLIHLDGSAVEAEEYDRMQRFLRLWRKLGWSIEEVDKALTGLGINDALGDVNGGNQADPSQSSDDNHFVDFDVFQQECHSKSGGCKSTCANDTDVAQETWICPDFADQVAEISPAFIHQLPAVIRVMEHTSLPLATVLAFWGVISTAGAKSLYSQLFLSHNIRAIDPVFVADDDGNYLTAEETISDHLPVLMAALRLKRDDINALLDQLNLPDALTLDSVSALYRHSVLLKFLRVHVTELPQVFSIYGNPFISAAATLTLLTRWAELETAGLDFSKLAFAISDYENPLRPLSLSQRTTLLLSKKLYDGLGEIWQTHPDLLQDNSSIDTALLRSKAALLFDAQVVESIVGLVNGTTVYSTNVPAGLTITLPETLNGRLAYTTKQSGSASSAALKITGRLTPPLLESAKSLGNNDPAWLASINRIDKQAKRFFDDVLSGLFAGEGDNAKAILLAGDVNDPQNPDAPENTAPVKRRYLLSILLPILRKHLAQRLIATEVAAATGLNDALTETLLTEVLISGSPATPVMGVFESLRERPAADTSSFSGYLIPSKTDTYTFIAINSNTQPSAMLDGKPLNFPTQQDDPSDVWISEPVVLRAGTLYQISLPFPAANLQWKTVITPRATVPASALLPNYASTAISTALRQVSKCAALLNGLSLTLDELRYLHSHAADFAALDFNKPRLPHVLRLLAYVQVRERISGGAQSLLDLFTWASRTNSLVTPDTLSTRIAVALGMEANRVSSLLATAHFNLNDPAHFVNEIHLAKLLDASQMADKTAVDVDRLFAWAKPGSQFWPMHRIAQDIRHITRARFEQSDWEQVVKPLSDTLRAKQRDALIAYLLVQPELRKWGVIDADSLFEFFLIDMQMDPCMETSRIKQAISSVQLFIQRCLLGLEQNVPQNMLNRERWEWMQRYRVWEANRKVFLYPENWIRSELRDDKSQFFKELESELLQRDLTEHNIEEAFQAYVFKVDGVAYLKVVGLYEETERKLLHVFARTRNAPYQFYYRTRGMDAAGYWTPWELMQVDIPSYETEDEPKVFGTYLAPIVANGRLLVFFPQFMKKTEPAVVTLNGKKPTIEELAKSPFTDSGTSEFWEIKLGWTEYRSGRWMQKQLSTMTLYDDFPDERTEGNYSLKRSKIPKISNYQFVPRLVNENSEVVIEIYRYPVSQADSKTQGVGMFVFEHGQVSKLEGLPTLPPSMQTIFHYDEDLTIKPLQQSASHVFTESPIEALVRYGSDELLTHKEADELVAGSHSLQALLGVLDYNSASISPENFRDRFGGGDTENQYHELRSPSAIYNWEVDFHAPMLVVERLLESQQYEQALTMCHYVLNPFAEGADEKRFWQFVPFKQVNPERVLERLFFSLQAGQPDAAITEWRNNPFQPHVVARRRPSAYMKWVAMKYIQILIAWGDHLFQQDTIETINQATQLYILASHAYGSKGHRIPKRGRTKPQTYFSLIDRWDAFSNAMVDLELAFPFSNQPDSHDDGHDAAVALTNIFGSASALYFCIPDNPELTKLRETIDDRLFKVRHCQNIQGVFRKLPLFEPPIDPALLVQAAAQGLSIASVLSDLNAPMPNYRFPYLLQRALEMCNEVKGLGAAFLSAKEKGDSEALSQLRTVHERVMTQRLLDTRKLQLEEAEKTLEALRESRTSPAYRLRHYLQTIGEDIAKIPGEGGEFTELPNSLLAPVDEGGLKLIPFEKEEMDKANEAQYWQGVIGRLETLASILHIIPSFNTDAKPFGIGMSSTVTSGWMLGNAAQAIGRGLQIHASALSFSSSNAGKKAVHTRVRQDRVMQVNSTAYELMNIDKQITTQQIRIAMAKWELENQQKQIDHALEVEDFLRNKYTNRDLYAWMESQISNIYYQTYTLAYELAKQAESAFRFERGLATSDFIRAGYWEAGHNGLFAGERLHLALKQMERAYQEYRGHDFEVIKNISLRQLNPFALLALRETGVCEFMLPEVLFDLDYPGHFRRQIKSVAFSIPCVVGPYTSLNCTLRLLEHKYRVKPHAQSADDYPEKVESDDRFHTVRVPIASIAASTAQSDSGVFELNFRDERYLPFEGAGVISKWRLELPSTIRQFDYSSISDVVVQLRYIASDGGDKLKGTASQAALKHLRSIETESREVGLFALIDLTHDYPSEWNRAMNGADEPKSIVLKDVLKHFPFFASDRSRKAKASAVYLFSSETLDAASLAEGTGTDNEFTRGAAIGELNVAVVKDVNLNLTDWTIKFTSPNTASREAFLLVNYALT